MAWAITSAKYKEHNKTNLGSCAESLNLNIRASIAEIAQIGAANINSYLVM
jgi:hypothetical protein